MKKQVLTVLAKVNVAFLMLFACLVQTHAQGTTGIPTTSDFANGAEKKGAFQTLFWLMEKGAQLIVIAIAVFFVFIIAKGAMKKYNDITEGRGGWIDLGGHVIGGIALLTLTIVMLNWVGTWVK
ncbi:MAG: DUF2976 domain-containing protein [Alteromonadaceae bacterium]|nr:DUF2976 domain-containing protein [Alteromonadaceae bacterium]